MGQRRRKLVTDCVRKLQGAAIDTFLPNPVVAYYDAAIFLDHARQAFDRWNGHAGRNRYCALQRGMINSWTLKALKGGNLSHLKSPLRHRLPLQNVSAGFPGFFFATVRCRFICRETAGGLARSPPQTRGWDR